MVNIVRDLKTGRILKTLPYLSPGEYTRRQRLSRKRWADQHKEELKEYGRQRWKDKKEILQAKNRAYNYNITEEVYNAFLIKQASKCAICFKDFDKTPCVDHIHGTEVVRGLLCMKCNFLIGHADDNPEILQNAKEYLDHAPKVK